MLVLSRKLGEVILIGDDIKITVVETEPGRVRLGIDAPRNVPIRRHELLPVEAPNRGKDPKPSEG